MVTSRTPQRVQGTADELNQFAKDIGTNSRVLGVAADVCKADDLKVLSKTARDAFGSIDIWINNAGTNAYSFSPLIQQSEEEIQRIVNTNSLGVILSSREAIDAMKDQNKSGHLFNMDGAGADGGPTPRFAAYGATKRSLEQLSKSLRAELQLCGIKNVAIHNISPGMVTTELLMAGADNMASRWFINCLAERPEDVASWMVPRIREAAAADPSSMIGRMRTMLGIGEYIRFLTKFKAYRQIFERLVLGKRKDRFVIEE